MKKVIFLLGLLMPLGVFPQGKVDEQGLNTPVGAQNVSIEYVCQDKNRVSLRISNNTRWTVSVKSDELYYRTGKSVTLTNGKEFYALPTDKEVSIQYSVDKFALPWESVKVPKIALSDTASLNFIASQDAVLFGVPLHYLNKNLQVYVRFNYEWEMNKQGVFPTMPEHRISFRGIDLPEVPVLCRGSLSGQAFKVK